jgi:putative ABC transport system substrate-binding protein
MEKLLIFSCSEGYDCASLISRAYIIRRRNFLAALGALSGTWSFTVRAQHWPNLKIGYLGSDSPDLFAGRLRAFHEGLNETGHAERSNLGLSIAGPQETMDAFQPLPLIWLDFQSP